MHRQNRLPPVQINLQVRAFAGLEDRSLLREPTPELFARHSFHCKQYCLYRQVGDGISTFQSTVLTSSGSISTNVHVPVAVEQERIPRRRIFTGVSSGKVRRYSALRSASVKTFSFSSPSANFTASTVAAELSPRPEPA